jgi:hypothetical protein
MKELLTKKFWRNVKNTFEAARADTTPTSGNSQAASPVEVKPEASPKAEIPAPSEATQAPE